MGFLCYESFYRDDYGCYVIVEGIYGYVFRFIKEFFIRYIFLLLVFNLFEGYFDMWGYGWFMRYLRYRFKEGVFWEFG